MPLIDINEAHGLLTCPLCGSSIEIRGDEALCSNLQCPRHNMSRGFPVVAGRWPVLVDFENSVIRADSFDTGPTALGQGTERPSVTKRIYRWFVRPENQAAATNMRRLDQLLPGHSPLILVVGGGTIGNGLGDLYANDRFRLIAFDIYPSSEVQFIADAHEIPLGNRSVDAVVIQAILEHVLDPKTVVSEIHRVLTDEGLVYAETPFMQQVHAGCYDFTRFSDSGHRWLFRNFDQVDRGIVAGPGTALLWSVDHLARAVFRSRAAGRLARLVFFWLRFFDRVADDAYGRDAASAFYFLGRKTESELKPQDVLAEYRGGQTV